MGRVYNDLRSWYAEFLRRWVPPRYIRSRNEEEGQKIREKYHIIVDGEDIPQPIEAFEVCSPHVYQADAHSLIGHEDTPTPIEVPEVKEDYSPDSHSAPGNTRSVRFRMLLFVWQCP